MARTFTFNEWGEALQVGAFDVLDVLCDLPKAAEAARRASGSFFLRHFWAPHEPVCGLTGRTPKAAPTWNLEDSNGFETLRW